MQIIAPHFGNYSKIIEKLGCYLGWEITVAPTPTERTIELGSKYMNELMCLPAKVILGSFIEAAEKGARHFLMFDSCGLCRLKCYWVLQERALRKLGYEATVYPIRLGVKTPGDIRRIDRTVPLWKAWQAFYKLLHDITRYDKKESYEIIDGCQSVKIGIVGEIYTILEPAINHHIVNKLEKMDVLVHNSLPLSYFIFKGFYDKGWMKRDGINRGVYLEAKKKTHQYFSKEVGGHGIESIIHTIYYALKGFDGVIHLLPFPCMPESTVATVIDAVSSDYNIPVMRLIFDVHTADGGLVTRLEALTDILKMKKQRKLNSLLVC